MLHVKENDMKNVYMGLMFTLAICAVVAGSALFMHLLPG